MAYHLYRALSHFKLFATHACAVKNFKGYLKIHTQLKITGKQTRMRYTRKERETVRDGKKTPIDKPVMKA